MRFCDIGLERYGDYERLPVHLGGAELNVVYGPNEAGKSTCLEAITDFLFGIPKNSTYGHYGYGAMRINAVLLLQDGRRIELRRRKGRDRTLTDENGKPTDESVLHRLLQGMSRERFRTLFGLGHEALREGGSNLLQAEGDVGQLILEAGGGLRSLIDRIGELEDQAKGLFATRRSGDRRFYRLCDQFRAASQDVKQGTLTFEMFRQANENLAKAQAEHKKLTDDTAALERRRSARERANRVLPLLAQLSQIEREMEAYKDVRHLRAEFAQDVQGARSAHAAAADGLEEAANRCQALDHEMAGLAVDEAVLGSEPEIRTIVEKAVHVRAERDSRPNREKELVEQQAKLVRLRELLNLSSEEELKRYAPPADIAETTRRVAREGRSLAERIASTEKQIRGYENELGLLAEKQHALERRGFDRVLSVRVPRSETLSRLQREIENRRRRAARLEGDVSRRLATWGFSDIEELRNFRCPDVGELDAHSESLRALQDQLDAESETLREAKDKLSAARKAIERLQLAGEVPTDSAIDRARSARKSAWEPIRSAYLSDDPEALLMTPLPERVDNANRLEGRIDDADRLADRKSVEAHRLTDLEAAERDRDEAAISIDSVEEANEERRERLARETRQFAEAWPQAIGKEHDLAKLMQLARDREENLKQAGEASELRDEARDRQAEVDQAIASLGRAEADLGIGNAPQLSIDVRIHNLEQAGNDYERGHARWTRGSAKQAQLEEQSAKARTELADLKTKQAQWQQKWQEAINMVGLPPDTTMDFAEQVMSEWSEARSALVLIGNILYRIGQFDRDRSDLERRIAALSPRLRFQFPEDPLAAADMLKERLDEAKSLRDKRSVLQEQKEEADNAYNRKKLRVEDLHRMVCGLCDEAGVEEATLGRTSARFQELTDSRKSRDQKIKEISAAGDEKSIDDLRAECAGLDPDGLRAELQGIQADKGRLARELQQAYSDMELRKRELEQFTQTGGINAAEARRQSAAAELRTVIERYVEVSLAHKLLNQAIDRLRDERQDPLIARAGELFKLATRGSYVGIGTDIDDRGIPVVVGKRPAGEEVRVDVMSDGTRDQLFLAFRIASVEQYCRQNEPVPFVADDLLVHFDDERSAAALELLAELGRNTQVLLFTHHRSVREMASSLTKRDGVAITDLRV